MDIILRRTAKAQGLLRYYSGKKCKYEHYAERLVSNGTCLECVRIVKNSDHYLKLASKNIRKRRKDNPEIFRIYDKNRRLSDVEKYRAISRKRWHDGNNQKRAVWLKQDRKKRPWIYTQRANARKQKVKLATPRWLTPEMRHEIIQKYKEAATFTTREGFLYHVDHIIPLSGKNVCGLHVPWNLQVIPASVNLSKSNKF